MRRAAISYVVALPVLGCASFASHELQPQASADGHKFPVRKTDAEWKKKLTPNQYDILRQART